VNVLVDSHALLWWLDDDRRLSRRARQTIADADTAVFVSVASVWEIAIKRALGKLNDPSGAIPRLPSVLADRGMRTLAIEAYHAIDAAALPRLHRDPFDRMIVAQSRIEGFPVVTNDAAIRAYRVATIW
jgi:PIN domain nuclease of toxin-antitoxin system